MGATEGPGFGQGTPDPHMERQNCPAFGVFVTVYLQYNILVTRGRCISQ